MGLFLTDRMIIHCSYRKKANVKYQNSDLFKILHFDIGHVMNIYKCSIHGMSTDILYNNLLQSGMSFFHLIKLSTDVPHRFKTKHLDCFFLHFLQQQKHYSFTFKFVQQHINYCKHILI